jgi:hypothetical protein
MKTVFYDGDLCGHKPRINKFGQVRTAGLLGEPGDSRQLRCRQRATSHETHENRGPSAVAHEVRNCRNVGSGVHGSIVVEPYARCRRLYYLRPLALS